MKHLMLSGLFSLMVVCCAYGQSVNGILLKDIDAEYIEMVGIGRTLFNSKENMYVDFGQAPRIKRLKDQFVIKGDNGEALEFTSMMEGLNLLSKNDFVFLQAYVTIDDKQSVTHFLLRKKNVNDSTSTGVTASALNEQKTWAER